MWVLCPAWARGEQPWHAVCCVFACSALCSSRRGGGVGRLRVVLSVEGGDESPGTAGVSMGSCAWKSVGVWGGGHCWHLIIPGQGVKSVMLPRCRPSHPQLE